MFPLSPRRSSTPDCPYCLERVKLVRLLSAAREILLCPGCETEFTLDPHTNELDLWLGGHTAPPVPDGHRAPDRDGPAKSYGNDLCRSCNHNQMIIVQLLHAYGDDDETSGAGELDEAGHDDAFDRYKRELEIKYPLCKLCRGVVRRKLDAQAALSRANYLSTHITRGKISVLASSRRRFARKALVYYLLLLGFALYPFEQTRISMAATALFALSYPAASLAGRAVSLLFAALRAGLLLAQSRRSDAQVPFFDAWPVHVVLLLVFVNPDLLSKFFLAISALPADQQRTEKEKRQLETMHSIIVSAEQNKENHVQRFAPRPSVLSMPGTGIEDTFALCSLQEDATAARSVSARCHADRIRTGLLVPALGMPVCSLLYVHMLSPLHQAALLFAHGSMLHVAFRRSPARLVLPVASALAGYMACFLNHHAPPRTASAVALLHAIVSVLSVL